MRRFIFLLSFLTFTQLSYGYSCPPPEFGDLGCTPKYFTLPQLEDSIHSMKNLTQEGKSFIFSKILNKENNLKIKLNLRTFPEEVCLESKLNEIDIFKDGTCSVHSLRTSLIPLTIYDKGRGRAWAEGGVNSDGTKEIKGGVEVSWDF